MEKMQMDYEYEIRKLKNFAYLTYVVLWIVIGIEAIFLLY